MAASELSAPVGRGAANRRPDVLVVQTLLLARGYPIQGGADGDCGDATIAAIAEFQSDFPRTPDAVVDPGGTTWRALSARYPDLTAQPPPATNNMLRLLRRPASTAINQGLTAVSNAHVLGKLGQQQPAV